MFYLLVLGILGVWRITHLLHAEDGPFQLAASLRRLAGSSVLGQAIDCFYCLSLWIAAPFAIVIGQSWFESALLWPALSAAAIGFEKVLQRLNPAEATYFEDKLDAEKSDVQLREESLDHDAGPTEPRVE